MCFPFSLSRAPTRQKKSAEKNKFSLSLSLVEKKKKKKKNDANSGGRRPRE
jgi:hypothetical protein